MNDQRDDADIRPENIGPKPRRPYIRPELVEYGTVSKLTQTGTGLYSDGGMMMMMACL